MKVKICGLTNLGDALAAIEAGADLLGFNFYPSSPRYIALEVCMRIVSELRARRMQVVTVGVFVNLPAVEMLKIMDTCRLDLAQLSGDESRRGAGSDRAARLQGVTPGKYRGAARRPGQLQTALRGAGLADRCPPRWPIRRYRKDSRMEPGAQPGAESAHIAGWRAEPDQRGPGRTPGAALGGGCGLGGRNVSRD